MTDDDVWKAQAEAFGRYLRTQRELAALSMRQLGALASVSNAYISQLERGQHQPSPRVIKSLAEALNLSTERLLVAAGVTDAPAPPERGAPADEGAPGAATSGGHTGSRPTGAPEGKGGRTLTEGAILADPLLTREHKEALLVVYRGFLAGRAS